MPPPSSLILTGEDIEQIVTHIGLDSTVTRLTQRLRRAMTDLDPARTVTPTRSGFQYSQPRTGLVEWMPIHEHGRDVTIKVVGYHPGNPSVFGLPTIVSTISAYDTATGHLTCLMDGVLPTALRTAAASAVASTLLAAPDSSTLGLIGCGAQGVAHVHALSLFFDLRRLVIADADPAAAASLAARCAAFGLDLPTEIRSIGEVVATADLLVTATSVDVGGGPLFADAPTRPHLHINAIGSDFPGKTEIPAALLQRAYVCPDFRPQAVVEGECQQLRATDIGDDIVTVCKHPGEYAHLRNTLTVYDSTGWSLQDQVVLRFFAELAAELGLGRQVAIERMTGDAGNPYDFLRHAPEGRLTLPQAQTHPHELPA